ncbi:zinc-binding dehydrogenase [Alicyclobacillus kakegawensis]|uniref:zinc-binding dehydrogenase n=1 Tax=Alicyclobacillus kakegawensis TaxID=392012 RepID=UPI00082CE6E5|nr:zinc-binding dehydrogenase [Alicyclobacillus kakegawensis]
MALRAVELSGGVANKEVLVYGVGPIGLHLILALRQQGARTVVAVGRSVTRREAAKAFGADEVIDATAIDVPSHIGNFFEDFDVAFECSGAPAGVQACLSALQFGGRLVQVGLSSLPFSMAVSQVVAKGLHWIGSCAFDADTFQKAHELICTGLIDPGSLVGEQISLNQVPSAFEKLLGANPPVKIRINPRLT